MSFLAAIRVAMSALLVNKPHILLADEPTGNLDSKTGAEILEEFKRLNREIGQTIIIVTHDSGIAAQIPRQITVMDGLIENDVSERAAEDETLADVSPVRT